MTWLFYALLSAIFAALTALLAKVGLSGINSNLATAIRTVVILLITWGIVFVSGVTNQVQELTKKNLLFLVLSGVTTGLSWLFYFKALQMGELSKVAPIDKLSVVFAVVLGFIFLHEQPTWQTVTGTILIAGGSLVLLLR